MAAFAFGNNMDIPLPTTKGSVLTWTGTDFAWIAPGANGTVPTSLSSDTNGLVFATPSGGSVPAVNSITPGIPFWAGGGMILSSTGAPVSVGT